MPLHSNFNSWVQVPNAQFVLDQAIEHHVASAAVGALFSAVETDRLYYAISGKTNYSESAPQIQPSTTFDWASVSKGVGTATTIARLVDRGWLSYELPVSAILPWFSDDRIRISHLLSHCSGLPAWLPLYQEMAECFQVSIEGLRKISVPQKKEWIKTRLATVALENLPGVKMAYSDLGFILLGNIIEAVTSMNLQDAVHSYVLGPLEMSQTDYRPIPSNLKPATEIPLTQDEGGRGAAMIAGEVHDENTWALGGVAGHAGLFGPIEDLMKFARGILDGFLTPESFKAISRRYRLPEGTTRTLGWDTPAESDSSCGSAFSKQSFGHLGFTGTSLWIDVEKKRAVGFLTNRVHPSRENIQIRSLRPQFHDAIIKGVEGITEQTSICGIFRN